MSIAGTGTAGVEAHEGHAQAGAGVMSIGRLHTVVVLAALATAGVAPVFKQQTKMKDEFL